MTNYAVENIAIAQKIGWDAASVCYQAIDDANGNQISIEAFQVDIDRVFYTFNFAYLGIGT